LRPSSSKDKARRVRLGIGALMIGIPASAAALATSQAPVGGSAPATDAAYTEAAYTTSPIQIGLKSDRIHYGGDVVVRGTEPSSDDGHTVALQFARAGTAGWRQLSSTTVGSTGAFRLAWPLERSGLVRALDVSSGTVTPLLSGGAGEQSVSESKPVEVAAQIRTGDTQFSTLAGQAVEVSGRLLPGHAGRKVTLQARQGGRWHTLAKARTGSRGKFVLRYVAGDTGQEQIRIRFSGDWMNGASSTHTGQLTVYREAVASWYDDGGNTACGFHAYDGVANKSLPCGTHVQFRYNGRSVTATVDDRGPYVGGRDWDLNQNTAAALGMGGVATVWSSK
jgi:rare lipoprotein A